jgi:hypothetical protein
MHSGTESRNANGYAHAALLIRPSEAGSAKR